ncbi:phage tail tube protein [Terrisporobacter muris]|jgi:predicted secreted protein|uniref:Phage tail tube protein n=1 Tax=Terrisporobacter muris TaxID=2963284 RepID=A0A9X2S320_9FIRM|nr:phage tail tube protein [Terrisporobacter muris]MCR1822001.1 phage tail tube protein [Terrisporobacter muris]
MATRSLGTVLKIGKDVSATKIGGLTEIGGIELSADTLDNTTLESDGGYREFIGGFKDAGEVSLSGYLEINSSNGQKKMYDAFETGDVQDFAIEFPESIGAKWAFKGVVTGFSTGASLEDLISFGATIKVSGKPTLTLE